MLACAQQFTGAADLQVAHRNAEARPQFFTALKDGRQAPPCVVREHAVLVVEQ